MPGPGAYWIGEEEKKEVLDVLESGHLFRYGQSDDPRFKAKVLTLEREVARYCGVKHCVATSSGTSALLAALKAIGVRSGDEVIVPAYTFVASYSSIIFAGGMPVLAEIDESLTVDPADIERRITPRTKAIMPVHMLGNSCDMDVIMSIARKHGLSVVEDSCQAFGASYRGKKAGAIGDIGAFSLNIYKTVTAGDGGLAVTDDDELYELAFGYHDQGHSPHRGGVEVGKRHILGLDLRMNEVTGAVALAQFRKLDGITAALRRKKDQLRAAIGRIDGTKFRTVHDPEGECGTLLTVIFDSEKEAKAVAAAVGTKTVDRSGWHVYSNMEHVMEFMKDHGRPCEKGAYPRTDDILGRSINISVGVVDAGLGAGFGINIESSDGEIAKCAQAFKRACQEEA